MSGTIPAAPGQLGVAARPADMLDYLGRLDAWLAERRAELDALDSSITAAGRQRELTGDLTLALALWQAVRSRYDLVLVTWDSGRVGQTELEKLSALIWGRLDTAGSAVQQLQSMSVSLPEAGRLCDALVAQLRTRLNLDPNAEQQALRIRDLRAQVERLRDQVALEPTATLPTARRVVDALAARTDELAAKRSRGGDVGGLLGPLEIDAARFERDLIVGATKRREDRELLVRARDQLNRARALEGQVRDLVGRAQQTIWPVPRFAVPDVAALGPLPNTREALVSFVERLSQVEKALQVVQLAHADALAGRDRTSGLLASLAAKAAELGLAGDPQLSALAALATDHLQRLPTVLPVADHLVAAYGAYLDGLADPQRRLP